jgi:hypothetical protein
MPYELTTEVLCKLSFPHLSAVFCVCKGWASYDADFFYDLLIEKHGLEVGTPCPTRTRRWVFRTRFIVPDEELKKFTGFGSAQLELGNYEGEWKDGLMHGYGTFFYKTNGEFNVRYDGEWNDGVRAGKGKMVWGKGGAVDSYEGEFLNNMFSGFGVFRWRMGDKYVGNWNENKRSGYGSFHWNAGDSYEGLWEDDLKSGAGKLKWHNGNEYHGSWKNELKESGKLYESATERHFEAVDIDYLVDVRYVHPDIRGAMDKKICTSSVTGKSCYFQYLWQTTQSSDRIHGVCLVCKEKCVTRNGYQLKNPDQFYFGGNFYCDCGTGRLGGECYAHH